MKTTGQNQNSFVLNHLIDHGYITDAIAQTYRIKRVASRIHDLTSMQGEFQALIQRATKHDELGQRYTYYFMSDLERSIQRGLRANKQRFAEAA